jgi:ABC-type dipeptide/oligopeptide/nickel transport system permease component
MLKYILKKILIAIPTILVVSFIIFVSVHLAPGDPINLLVNPMASQELRQQVKEQYGLDKPVMVQYFKYISNVLKGDFGRSLKTHKPVIDMISERLPATLILTVSALLFAYIVSLPIGVLAALRQNTIVDRGAMLISIIGIGIPSFWLSLMLIIFFGLHLKWLPISGFTSFKHLLMPMFALSLETIAINSRMTRSSMLEVINQDFVTVLRAKGLPERRVIWVHALKNGLISIVTVLGLRIGWLIGGNVVVEYVFSWPGLGRQLVDSIVANDFPLIQGIMLIVSALIIFGNLLADILYVIIDPRIKY